MPVTSWTGFYAGVNGGYGWSNSDNPITFSGATFDQSHGFDSNGGFGGGQIGYNWQGGLGLGSRLVYGIEADIQGADINDDVKGFTAAGNQVNGNSNLDWFGTVRGRIGYGFDSTLVYFTGGFAYGGADNSITLTAPPVPGRILETATLKKDDTLTGYVLGGGVEYKIAPAWSLKAEYQYISLGSESLSGVSNFGHALKTSDIDNNFQTVRVGFNYHFGSTYEPLK